MIIVSQDKSEIINFDKVQNIYVSGRFISLNFELNNNEVIGTYETEERAKEVLNEIVKKYADCLYSDDGYGSFQTITIPPKVYKMPEE